MNILTIFEKNHKFQRFANFRIKIEPIVDSFSLILKKTFSSKIFREQKKISFTPFLLTNGFFFFFFFFVFFFNQKFSGKILEITDDHNFGTQYARDMKFVSKCVVLDTLLYSTNNQKNYRNDISYNKTGNQNVKSNTDYNSKINGIEHVCTVTIDKLKYRYWLFES